MFCYDKMFVQAHIVHRQLKNKSILLAVDDCCSVFEELSSFTHQILPYLNLPLGWMSPVDGHSALHSDTISHILLLGCE